MPRYSETQPDLDLLTAVKEDMNLPDATWEQLKSAATPYQRRCARMLVDPTIAAHGLYTTYLNYGCRCELCGVAYSESRRTKRVTEDFSEDADTTPAQIKALRAEVAAGRALTPKGAEVLAAYDATEVL